MKNIFCMVFVSLFAIGCNESFNQIKISTETKKLIDSMPTSANTDYTVYLSMAGDCKSGAIFVTVETPTGTERRPLKTFKSEDGSKIDGQTILKYIGECNEFHNKVNKVKADSAETATALVSAKNELVAADQNVIKAKGSLDSAIKAENNSRAEIERLKAALQEQELICATRVSERGNAEKNLNDAQSVLLGKKNAFNGLKNKIESINMVILGIVEQIGQANGKNTRK